MLYFCEKTNYNFRQLASIVFFLLFFPTFVMANKLSFSGMRGYYLGFGAGYSQNVASGKDSNIRITSPGPIPIVRQVNNKSGADGVAMRVDAGYILPLVNNWSWSIGGRVEQQALEQKGKAQYVGEPTTQHSYRYDVRATLATIVGRLLYTNNRWQYYGELNAGIAFLNSSDNRVDNGNQINYKSKTVHNMTYGVALGVMRQLNARTSMGVSIEYSDLGKTELGAPELPAGSSSTGSITQPLDMMTATINIVHWF